MKINKVTTNLIPGKVIVNEQSEKHKELLSFYPMNKMGTELNDGIKL